MYNVPLNVPSVRGIPSLFRLSSSFSPSATSLFDALVMAFRDDDTFSCGDDV